MKPKHYTILLLLLSMMVAAPAAFGQRKENYHENQNPFGRKKKEKKNQSKALSRRGGGGLFKKKHSAGNADAFASNSIRGGHGFLYKIFHPGGGSGSSKNASLRKTRPGKVQNRENSRLFHRHTTKNKNRNGSFLKKQNKERSSRRSRGNSGFHKKKRR